MNNISYTIKELNNTTDNNEIDNADANNYNIIDDNNDYNMDFLVYNSYNVKQLCLILQFYDISKNRMCKDEIIQTILLYETDEYNLNIVNKRKYLWSIARQLKKDDFFSKYIVVDIK